MKLHCLDMLKECIGQVEKRLPDQKNVICGQQHSALMSSLVQSNMTICCHEVTIPISNVRKRINYIIEEQYHQIIHVDWWFGPGEAPMKRCLCRFSGNICQAPTVLLGEHASQSPFPRLIKCNCSYFKLLYLPFQLYLRICCGCRSKQTSIYAKWTSILLQLLVIRSWLAMATSIWNVQASFLIES